MLLQIDLDKGDRLIIDVYNDLGNQSTGIHWHGLHEYMTGYMDGTSGVTQCPIPPGRHMRYEVNVNQVGTYWYHSHNMGQYPDGLRGAIVVHDPDTPFEYDEEYTVTLSDWYHRQMVDLLNEYESPQNEINNRGLEPLPDAALINDASNVTFKVEPLKTYLFRIIDLGNWPGFGFGFIGHNITVVEVDGIWTDPYEVPYDEFLRVATGQRMSVLVHTHEDTSQNFAFWTTMDVNMMFFNENRPKPAGFNENATAWLVYDESKPLPAAPVYQPEELVFVDDLALVPADHEPLLEPVNHRIVMDFNSANIDGVHRWVVNNITYLTPEVPTLYTALTIGEQYIFNQEVYGQVNPYVLNYGDVVEIILNDYDSNLHPWHLHGHHFQALQRTDPNGGYFDGYFSNISSTPIKRDTLMVQSHGHFVIRFRATNPDM
ncbi:hypothetical protein MPDQ_007931 [Monascus purpureus]|uniref:Uncharacterized protein n=1 Tax=Monascus purpureus TaxID=5098 RepID=A0A507QR64_MONPU|nr:hypothetical protein MPDQ_007931 [Monascus purpureus]